MTQTEYMEEIETEAVEKREEVFNPDGRGQDDELGETEVIEEEN